jgi:hypothetical protein
LARTLILKVNMRVPQTVTPVLSGATGALVPWPTMNCLHRSVQGASTMPSGKSSGAGDPARADLNRSGERLLQWVHLTETGQFDAARELPAR